MQGTAHTNAALHMEPEVHLWFRSPPLTYSAAMELRMASRASRLMQCRGPKLPLATGRAVLEMRAHMSSNRLARSSLHEQSHETNTHQHPILRVFLPHELTHMCTRAYIFYIFVQGHTLPNPRIPTYVHTHAGWRVAHCS